MRILLADDDIFSRVLLGATLKKLGHKTVFVSNGREAIDTFRQSYFPVVISAWAMPKVDGLELCRLIREAKPPGYTYIILLTALGGSQAYLEGLKAGADDFLTKPFDEQLLAARLTVGERILKVEDVNRRLAQLILICSYCKKARNDEDYWEKIEELLVQQPDLQLSHGICPDCYEKTVQPQLAAFKGQTRLVR